MSLPVVILIAAGCFMIGFRLGRATTPKPTQMPVFSLHQVLSATEQRAINHLIEQGEIIAAIKEYKEMTGASLKTAKEAIDQMRANKFE